MFWQVFGDAQPDEVPMTEFDLLSHEAQLAILLELANKALEQYALPAGSHAALLNLSENATYKVEAPDGRCWALRVHRDGYHSRQAIASELAWEIDLRKTGVVTTPRPIKGKDGETIQDIAHERLARPRNVVLFDWESGTEPGIGEDLSEPFEVLGEITARMHIHARQWKRPPWFTRLTWDFDTSLGDDKPHWGRWRDGVGMDREKVQLFQRTVDLIGRRLKAYGKGPERFGLIHCDLRLANLLIDAKAVKVIDFDDCGFGWYMYDAATPVSFYEHEVQVPELIESWKKGYRKQLAISVEDEAEIPTFIMLRRILLVAWIASHIEAEFPKTLGAGYTDGSLPLCEDYLRRFS
ncbi:phosphotransferase enzyme family protein [Aestuariivirga sp.]|uniref:phosphotransferase enzyme family protein n=1 Tax=Aestuariivirga sp. TaxID=2650926 RepID=UPI003BAA1740